MRKQPKAEQFTAIVDTREKTPFDLSPLRVVRGKLDTGDYSIVGLTHHIAIERKSIDDFVACCGRERDRFERELMRLLAYPVRAVVVEGSMADLEAGAWRSKMDPFVVCATLAAWNARGLSVVLAGNPKSAGTHVARMLFYAARDRYREALALMGEL